MNRREFSVAAAATVALAAVGLPGAAWAQAARPQAGTDYLALDARAPVEAPAGKIEVVEFFWYDCPHCNAFEPTLEAWIRKAPAYVVVRRVPVGFRDSFVPQQRLYYALEAMGELPKLHAKVFAAIHSDKPELPKSAKGPEIADWVSRQGVDKARFLEQYNSFSTASKVSKASQLQNVYKVSGVPALGVAGRFYTDGELARSMARSLQVVDFLIAEVRAGR